MADILASLNLEQLGVTGILVAFLIYQNYNLSQSVREERTYSKELADRYQQLTIKTIETLGRLEQAFVLLKDGLR